jgi:hypothetical protein
MFVRHNHWKSALAPGFEAALEGPHALEASAFQ